MDIRTEFRIRCIRLDKVTAVTDMLQHERKNLCLPGNTVDSFESLFSICEIKRIAHSSDQGLDVPVTFKLFKEGLSVQK